MDGLPRAGGARNDEESARVAPGKHRRLQRAGDGGRRMFDEAAQREFLELFAASCNVRWAARAAGFAAQTIYKHLMKDERFREGFGRALEQGFVRLQAELLAKAAGTAAIPIDGDRDGPDGEIDVELSLTLLREHARGLALASGAGRGKAGRTPRVATNAEVRAALEKRLRAYSARVLPAAGGAAGGEE
ncbi:hypothetical protein [Sphingosinicella sp.]|uniref:hypothetical protein n=1 Tax=Sphingosinicella sp. TaxID=1917971 RepID=UPI004037C159